MPESSWGREDEHPERPPSQSWYDQPETVTTTRHRVRSVPAWNAHAGMGHSIGLGYLILTLRELTGLSQSKIAKRVGTGQPAIARLESGRQLPTANTLLKVASSCGMELVIGLADPELDPADLCLHDLTLLGILSARSGRPRRLLRGQGAAAVGRRRMIRAAAARSVGESPTASIDPT